MDFENKPWRKNITIENLPNEDLKILASVVGLSATIKLICEYPGILISVPKSATLQARIDYVKEHYDGSKKSRCELSKICELSERAIYKITRERNDFKPWPYIFYPFFKY